MAKQKPDAAPSPEPKVDLLGQLTVELDGTEYVLRPSRQAISDIERELGKALPQIAVQAGSIALPVSEMAVCVAEFMRATAAFDPNASADYRGAKAERLADLIYEAGSVAVSRRLAIILIGAINGGYTASGEVKATGMTTTEQTPIAN